MDHERVDRTDHSAGHVDDPKLDHRGHQKGQQYKGRTEVPDQLHNHMGIHAVSSF